MGRRLLTKLNTVVTPQYTLFPYTMPFENSRKATLLSQKTYMSTYLVLLTEI